MDGLFRQQAIDEQRQRLQGTIILTQPLSITISSTIITIIVFFLVLYACLASVTRKEIVNGYVASNLGLIRSTVTQGGTITSLYVKEGEHVEKGAPLAEIIVSHTMNSGKDLKEILSEKLREQITILENEKEINKQFFLSDKARLKNNVKNLNEQLAILQETEIRIKEQLKIAKDRFRRYTELYQKKSIPKSALEAEKDRLIEVEKSVLDSERDHLALLDNLAKTHSELEKADSHYHTQSSELKISHLDLQRQLTILEGDYRYIIHAAKSGVVTAIQIVPGQSVSATQTLMSIIPGNAQFVANLLLPTRSVGFVEEGDEVNIRFDAFPYQRFGFVKGRVVTVDKALLTNDSSVSLPIQIKEPVYRVKVALSAQSISAYGKHFPLKHGMSLQADILLDKRTLLEWILDPLYSIKGRLG